jgi:hypothetical protein
MHIDVLPECLGASIPCHLGGVSGPGHAGALGGNAWVWSSGILVGI